MPICRASAAISALGVSTGRGRQGETRRGAGRVQPWERLLAALVDCRVRQLHTVFVGRRLTTVNKTLVRGPCGGRGV
jgi:hypothetical protein